MLSDTQPTASLPAGVVVSVGMMLLAFWPTLASFPGVWIEERTHGFVIAAFCAWMIWRTDWRAVPVEPASAGTVALLVGLSCAWSGAELLSLRVVHQLLFPAILLAWIVAVKGRKVWPVAAPIAATFVLAVPLWEVLIRPLQRLTVIVNSLLLKIVGIEATIDADMITVSAGTFLVAGSCAGLNYLMSGITIGVMYGALFLERWTARVQVLLAAIAVSLVANWLRVFGLIVIGDRTRMQSPLMTDHGTYGWLVFAGALPIFFLLARRIDARDAAAAHRVAQAPGTLTLRTAKRLPSIWLATGAAMLGPVLHAMIALVPPDMAPSAETPGIAPGAEWRRGGTAGAAPSDWAPGYRGASEHRVAYWIRGDERVRVDRMIYAAQAQGSELINELNRIAPEAETLNERFAGPLDEQTRIVREATVRSGNDVRLVWYWYSVAGMETPSPLKAKLLESVAFVQRRPVAELIAVSATCETTDCRRASQSLYALVTGNNAPRPREP